MWREKEKQTLEMNIEASSHHSKLRERHLDIVVLSTVVGFKWEEEDAENGNTSEEKQHTFTLIHRCLGGDTHTHSIDQIHN